MSERSAALSRDPLIGIVLANRYQIEERLGEGAMGAVYKAKHVKVGRPFAIKVLHTRVTVEPKVAQRFEREAELAGRLRHPNVVGVVDVGETPDGQRFMVMDFAAGQDLANLMVDAPFPQARIVTLTRQLLEGLYHAHEAGLIHRDFKPENVIVEKDDHGNEVPRIVDFGIAILREGGGSPSSEGRLTTNGLVLGTPHYMAPEQAIADPIDHRIDLFAMGIVIYEMLSGKLPFDGSGAEVARANLVLDPPPIAQRAPGVTFDPLLEAFARRLMAKRREERPPTAKAARELLDLIERDRTAAAKLLGVALPSTETRAPAMTAPAAAARRHDPNSQDTFPPPIADPTAAIERALSSAEADRAKPPGATTSLTEPLQFEDEPPRKRTPLWVYAAGGVAVIGAIIALAIGTGGGDDAPKRDERVAITEPPPAPPPPVPAPAQQEGADRAVVADAGSGSAIAPVPAPPTPTAKKDPKVRTPKQVATGEAPVTKPEVPKPAPPVAKTEPAIAKPEPAKPKRAPITRENFPARYLEVGGVIKGSGTPAMREAYSRISYSDALRFDDKLAEAIRILTKIEHDLGRR